MKTPQIQEKVSDNVQEYNHEDEVDAIELINRDLEQFESQEHLFEGVSQKRSLRLFKRPSTQKSPRFKSCIQPKLVVGQPDNKFEREADYISNLVVNRISSSPWSLNANVGRSIIHRTSDGVEAKPPQLAPSPIAEKLGQKKGRGHNLPPKLKAQMQQAFGSDFSQVRLHTDADAIQLNNQLGARAFTYGSDIYFNRRQYQPFSTEGQRLLAHELTHVVQQEGPRKLIQRQSGEDLIDSHSSFLNLDEARLGKTLYHKALHGHYNLIEEVFDKLGSTDRDDVALGFMENAEDLGLLRISGVAPGRRLLDRFYDELTSGSAGNEELHQSDRILRIKAQNNSASEFPQDLGQVKVFPFHSGWANNTVYRVSRQNNGDITVRMTVISWANHRMQLRNVPEKIATSGITLKENEIIGVKQIDEGGGIIYRPALIMVQLQNQSISDTFNNVVTVAGIGLTLGTGALVGSAARGAGWLARAAVWGERAALAIDVITNIIRENRGWIIRTFGQTGRRFIYFNELLSSAAALYGLATVVVSMGRLITNFKRAFSNWRTAAGKKTYSEAAQQTVAQISHQGDELIENVDQIQASRPNISNRANVETSQPQGTGRRTERVETDQEINEMIERGIIEEPSTTNRPIRRPRPTPPLTRGQGEAARKSFNRLRNDYAQRLGVNSGGQVHHAIELQVLDRYPGVFNADELNDFTNMRGIGNELENRRQLHNSKIREIWDRHYRQLDTQISNQELQPGSQRYNDLVRRYLESGREEIDYVLGQFFTEYRLGLE